MTVTETGPDSEAQAGASSTGIRLGTNSESISHNNILERGKLPNADDDNDDESSSSDGESDVDGQGKDNNMTRLSSVVTDVMNSVKSAADAEGIQLSMSPESAGEKVVKR